ncbi:MAG: SUMF1/EgtB/PvdO family nonheme iron enzyme [Proteobacteria bacterium]|nr:SUMF1/EgtB/PvdO family nonheme iron enzyme [Pseudomonadota bacterium]
MTFYLRNILLFIFVVGLTCFATDSLFAENTDLNTKINRIRILKQEFKDLNKKVEDSYKDNFYTIEKNYYLLINRAQQGMPNEPEPKDMFETQLEYSKRMSDYKKNIEKFEKNKAAEIKKIKQEFNLRYYMSMEEVNLLKGKIKATEKVIHELESIQNNKFILKDDDVQIILFEPESDKYRFPIHFLWGDNRIQKYWDYTDRDTAREFWKNKAYLKAEKLSQFECKGTTITPRFTTIRAFNTRTGESHDYVFDQPQPFEEITQFYVMKNEALPAAELMVALKDVIKGPVADMNFIFISPRTYIMGSPRDEVGRWASEVQHKVKLTQGFYLQTTEVTQDQWRDVMGDNPSIFSRCGSDCPVENVFWGDVMEFIDRLNKREGTKAYRLPTEAEWEFACRAGSPLTGAYGNDTDKLGDFAWFKNNSEDSPHPVAQLKPNAWGLFDMHGNVSEWCSDWRGPYPDHDVTDPRGPYSGKFRVARGGNWFYPARSSRSADRNENLPGDRSEYLGFRVAKTP